MDSHLVENRDTICSSYGSPQSSGALLRFYAKLLHFSIAMVSLRPFQILLVDFMSKKL